MHWGDIGPWGWGAVLSWTVLALLVLAALVTVIVVALRRPSHPGSGGAERILAERFARGEIDEEEFHHRLRALRG